MVNNIVKKKVLFPSKLELSREVIDLIIKLLKKDPEERIGHKKGITDIMMHVWFNDIKWKDQILAKNFDPQLKPDCKEENVLSYKSAKTFQDNDDTDYTKKEQQMVEAYEDTFDDQYFERDDISLE